MTTMAPADRQPRVDAGPVRAHARRLLKAGLLQSQIARAAGMPECSLTALLHGKDGRRQLRINTRRAEALLAVPFPTEADIIWVDAAPVKEHLRKLHMHYTQAAIGEAVCMDSAEVCRLLNKPKGTIRRHVADRISGIPIPGIPSEVSRTLTPRRIETLRYLADLSEPATAATLAARLGVDATTGYAHLSPLEDCGCIQRVASPCQPPGRTATRWEITDTGRAALLAHPIPNGDGR